MINIVTMIFFSFLIENWKNRRAFGVSIQQIPKESANPNTMYEAEGV